MARMSVTRRSALMGGAGALAALAQARHTRASTMRPNIIFIMADDLGYADVSCYGRREYQTPNIDSLAADGVKFLRAYASSAVCSATRTALITGRYQGRLDAGLDEPGGPGSIGMPPGFPTMPLLLKRAGYQTALIGKWHLGSLPEYGPLQSGYDHFYGIRQGGSDYFRHDSDLWEEDRLVHQVGYLTDLLGDNAVSTIENFSKGGRPFLISLHFNAPHWPWEGPEDQAESERLHALKGGMADFDGGSMKTFSAMVMRMDFQIGRVLDVLKKTGQAENTIVIFTSDNGGERYSDTWPFSGKKTELLEGGLRIPAIVRWPGHAPAGSSNNQAIISMDWVPTFLSIVGAKADPKYPLDGMDITRWLTGETRSESRKLFWRYNSKKQEAALDGDWKYLKILGNTFLFNVMDDPMERANLKDRYPERYASLKAAWEAWNLTMLPYTPDNFSDGFSGEQLADHFGAPKAVGTVPMRRR